MDLPEWFFNISTVQGEITFGRTDIFFVLPLENSAFATDMKNVTDIPMLNQKFNFYKRNYNPKYIS